MRKRLGRPAMLIVSVLFAGGTLLYAELAPAYRWKRPLTPDEREKLESIERSLAAAEDPVLAAALLGKLAAFAHEEAVGLIVPYLARGHSPLVRMEAAYALGEISAPSCIPPLVAFYSTAEAVELKIAALHSLSRIAGRLPPRLSAGGLRPMLERAREFFSSLPDAWNSLADGISAWERILAVFGGDEEVERLAFSLIPSPALTERVKADLCRLFVGLPLKRPAEDARILSEQFGRMTNVRLKLAAIKVLAKVESSASFLLAAAMNARDPLVKREAVRGLKRTGRLPSPRKTVPLLAEDDPVTLREIMRLIATALDAKGLGGFVAEGLGSRDRTIARRSCVVLRLALERWRRTGDAPNWKAAVEHALPALLDILENDASPDDSLRREAWFAFLSLLPPGSAPGVKFDWDAPLPERARQARKLRAPLGSPGARKLIEKRIEACCSPSPSPAPSLFPSLFPSRRPGRGGKAGDERLPTAFHHRCLLVFAGAAYRNGLPSLSTQGSGG